MDGLSAYDQLTPAGRVATLRQGTRPGLPGSTHEAAHLNLYLTDGVKVVTVVDVYHDEFEILHLLEIVGQREASVEVGVQIIIDDFSFGNFNPRLAFLFVQTALGVGLTERVQVFELAP